MSEHLDRALADLADLDTDRLGVRPAPAADLRSRGDQQRRRRYALTTLAAAAVVAVVGLGLNALTTSPATQPSPAPSPETSAPTEDAVDEPSPSPTNPAVELSIPDGFPLNAGYPETNEDGTPVRVTKRPGVGGVTLCGHTILASAGASAVAGTKYVGIEDFRARTLLVFESTSDAQAVARDAERVVRQCPEFDFSSYTPVGVPLGETSFGFDQRYAVEQGGFDLGLQAYQLVQVGRAVLISTAYGEANGSDETRSGFNQRLTDDARAVVDSMADARWDG